MSSSPEPKRNPWVQWIAIGAIVFVVYVLATRAADLPLVGGAAPDITLPLAAGGDVDSPAQVQLSALQGGVVVLDFWASWCTACRRTSPILNALYEKFAPEGVMFYAINVEAIDRQRLQAAHLAFGTAFPTLHDRGGSAQRSYDVKMLPTVVVVGPDGMVRWAKSGVPSKSDLRDAISEAMN